MDSPHSWTTALSWTQRGQCCPRSPLPAFAAAVAPTVYPPIGRLQRLDAAPPTNTAMDGFRPGLNVTDVAPSTFSWSTIPWTTPLVGILRCRARRAAQRVTRMGMSSVLILPCILVSIYLVNSYLVNSLISLHVEQATSFESGRYVQLSTCRETRDADAIPTWARCLTRSVYVFAFGTCPKLAMVDLC